MTSLLNLWIDYVLLNYIICLTFSLSHLFKHIVKTIKRKTNQNNTISQSLHYPIQLLPETIPLHTTLEYRTTHHTSVKIPIHCKVIPNKQDRPWSHLSYLSTFGPNTLVMYTHGYKLEAGSCGAEWVIKTADRAIANKLAYNRDGCHMNNSRDVSNAELHVIAESLTYLSHKDWIEGVLIYVDNQSTLWTLESNNPDIHQYAVLINERASKTLFLNGVCTSAYCRIQRNEQADS